MLQTRPHHASEHHLRLVFDDRVVFRKLGTDATGEDIARTLQELAPMRLGQPVAISVILGSAQER